MRRPRTRERHLPLPIPRPRHRRRIRATHQTLPQLIHAVVHPHMRVVDVVLWVESLADEVEAAELVEDVEAGDEVRGVGGEARGGVGEVGCFEGGDPGEAEVCGDVG